MNLKKIASNVQNISEAIASVIKVDVTVVDDNLRRIAGTGSYRDRIGELVSRDSVFDIALKKGEGFIIENAREETICLHCKKLEDCQEYAEVCCPIKLKEHVVGVIGLIAFDEGQRQEIVHNQRNLMTFLSKMADLICSKLLEENKTEEIKLLASELEIVLNSVDKGIIAVNEEGTILRCNENALQLFNGRKEELIGKSIHALIGDFNVTAMIREDKRVRNREFLYKKRVYQLRGVFDANPISIDNDNVGMVFIISRLTDLLNAINAITTATIVTSFEEIIGESEILREVKERAAKASCSKSTVLIQGESGTGKELFARAIHYNSDRAKGPFIPINCAAIPEQLLESELFGYEEGAFTGARRGGREGKFLLATGGTIFLDEIGDMPLHLQGKLLRVLQEQMIEKIGGKDLIPIDIRIIAATNKELDRSVQEGEFREDLFYRLNVIPLNIPPLRQRREDIAPLVKHMLEKCNRKLQKSIVEIDPDVMALFMKYTWPGNVRELENTIEYAVNMSNSSNINKACLPKRITGSRSQGEPKTFEAITPVKELERREIQRALAVYKDDNITAAAHALGISRATLYRKIKEYEL